MPVQVVGQTNPSDQTSHLIEPKTIIDTIEKNRDRVRTLVTMMIMATSILFSANLALIALLKDKLELLSVSGKGLLLLSPLLLLAALITAMSSVFLRQSFTITSVIKFIDNLQTLYLGELRMARIAFVLLLLGLCSLGALMFATLLNFP